MNNKTLKLSTLSILFWEYFVIHAITLFILLYGMLKYVGTWNVTHVIYIYNLNKNNKNVCLKYIKFTITCIVLVVKQECDYEKHSPNLN